MFFEEAEMSNTVKEVSTYLNVGEYQVFVRAYRIHGHGFDGEFISYHFQWYEIDGSTPGWVDKYCNSIAIPSDNVTLSGIARFFGKLSRKA